MFRNNKGLTLVEVLISLVITLVVFLGLMQTAMLTMDANVNNLLREEAVSIGENMMRELRELAAADLPAGPWTAIDSPTLPIQWVINPRTFRNMTITYTQVVTITDIGAGPVAKQIQIRVRYQTPKAPADDIDHIITTIKRL